MPRVVLASLGDSNDPLTWSGIPSYFLQTAKSMGLIDEGLRLNRSGLQFQTRRAAWNLSRLLVGERRGGYQYSKSALAQMWAPVADSLSDSVVINCFQLTAETVIANKSIERWHYIDMTFEQLLNFYDAHSIMGKGIAREALTRERDGYRSSAGVIAHSHWAAQSLRDYYSLPPELIHVALPGASLDAEDYALWESSEDRLPRSIVNTNLRLVFTGRDWKRKGLDRLLGAVQIAHRKGSQVTLRVIGCRAEQMPAEMRNIAGVEWLGAVNKRSDARRFLELVSGCHIGCLLSLREAGGIGLREFTALGLAVIGTDSGGSPEHCLPGSSVIVPASASTEEIAQVIIDLDKDRDRLHRMREYAWEHRHQGLWSHSVSEIREFWPHPANSAVPSPHYSR